MPPDLEPPAAVKVLSEVLFSIKTSIHGSNRTIVSEAIGEANAEWDERVEGNLSCVVLRAGVNES